MAFLKKFLALFNTFSTRYGHWGIKFEFSDSFWSIISLKSNINFENFEKQLKMPFRPLCIRVSVRVSARVSVRVSVKVSVRVSVRVSIRVSVRNLYKYFNQSYPYFFVLKAKQWNLRKYHVKTKWFFCIMLSAIETIIGSIRGIILGKKMILKF